MEERRPDSDRTYLEMLGEETMRLAWGERTPEERRRIVTAALLFGRKFEEKMEHEVPASEAEERRFLMDLMNAVIGEFARSEGMSRDEAASFLGSVPTRDYILELNEAIETYEAEKKAGRSLDEILREAVERRRERAVWARHWSSG